METNAIRLRYKSYGGTKRRRATSQETAQAISDFLRRQEEKQNHYKRYNQEFGYTHTQPGKCDCCPLWKEDL